MMLEIVQKTGQGIRFYHPDHLGSTTVVTDLDGEVTQNVAYIPYGEVFVEQRNGTWNTPYLFNAKELDEETGLYYYGARYLDPTGTRWLSVDPLFEKYVGMTPYNYCMGNPIVMIDSKGKNAARIVDEENKEITIVAKYYVQTEARPYFTRSKKIQNAKFIKGFSEKEISEISDQTNKYLNGLNLTVSEGEYAGYKIKFDLEFINGGSVENCENMAENATYEGIPVGNSLTKGSESIYPRFAAEYIVDNNGYERKRQIGGTTRNRMHIMMNISQNTKMNRIHEIFHTFGFSHAKGIGGSHGIMSYPPETPDQLDANELINNNYLKTIKKK